MKVKNLSLSAMILSATVSMVLFQNCSKVGVKELTGDPNNKGQSIVATDSAGNQLPVDVANTGNQPPIIIVAPTSDQPPGQPSGQPPEMPKPPVSFEPHEDNGQVTQIEQADSDEDEDDCKQAQLERDDDENDNDDDNDNDDHVRGQQAHLEQADDDDDDDDDDDQQAQHEQNHCQKSKASVVTIDPPAPASGGSTASCGVDLKSHRLVDIAQFGGHDVNLTVVHGKTLIYSSNASISVKSLNISGAVGKTILCGVTVDLLSNKKGRLDIHQSVIKAISGPLKNYNKDSVSILPAGY